ncbi:endocuticle structural glycoprotein SgAbd-1-like [Palaemon carinicauda]|uniref:endocuticle structural glycoprotein SgAbd-1-like n=1 Tax=Palaemon carinicauda TaxID=392227 RepID=UPI0035B632FB
MIQRVIIALYLSAIALAYPNLLEGGHHHAHDHAHDAAHNHAAATPDVHLETPADPHAHSAGYDIQPPPPPPPALYVIPSPATPPSPPALYVTPTPATPPSPPVLYVTPTPATPPSPPVLYVTPKAATPPPSLYETPDGGSVGSVEEEEEPTPFKYVWAVSDADAGVDFGHESDFDGQAEKGQYHVVLPDGRTLTVVYVADATGYNPVVTFEGEAHYPEPVPDPIHTLYETPA